MPNRRPERAGLIAEDRGAAVVEFALVSILLVFLLFAVLQIAAVFYVRSVVASAAADGARYGAGANVDPGAGAARATAMIGAALSPGMARHLPCDGQVLVDPASDLAMSSVSCRGQIRSIFLPVGALIDIGVSGQSLKERP